MPRTRTFPIAPMDTTITILTAIVLSLVPLLLGAALVSPVVGPLFLVVDVLLVGLYAFVWVWCRPSAFEVTDTELRYVYPARERAIPLRLVRGAKIYSRSEFQETFGWGVRVGVGGLWGGFGLLITPRGTFDMAITCLDDLVVVRCEGRRDLLVTPADAEGFAIALKRRDRVE